MIARASAAILLLAGAGYAQTSRGTVAGTVQDTTSAVVRGVRITLRGVDTDVQLSTITNEAGLYRFDAVDPGVYEVTILHPGFRSYSLSGS